MLWKTRAELTMGISQVNMCTEKPALSPAIRTPHLQYCGHFLYAHGLAGLSIFILHLFQKRPFGYIWHRFLWTECVSCLPLTSVYVVRIRQCCNYFLVEGFKDCTLRQKILSTGWKSPLTGNDMANCVVTSLPVMVQQII